MRTVSFTEFRNNTSLLLSAVEKGEILLILRHGKPIAKIVPPDKTESVDYLLREPLKRIIAKGRNLSSAILEERETS